MNSVVYNSIHTSGSGVGPEVKVSMWYQHTPRREDTGRCHQHRNHEVEDSKLEDLKES
jgi:hypothetical protein